MRMAGDGETVCGGARGRRAAQRRRDRRPLRALGRARARLRASGSAARRVARRRRGDGRGRRASSRPRASRTACCSSRAATGARSVCAPCSEVYRGDAWQLVVSGLRGGKGVPETVAEHPLVFATFTAPSFGPVHTIRESRRQAAAPAGRAAAARRARTAARSRARRRHADDDPCLGEAICPDCFDYERCALWNHNAGRLFKRTRTYVERELARQAGVTQKAARERVRVSYVKVAEFQRRGVVHFHTLWRLDAARRRAGRRRPSAFDAQLLADAITAALPKSTVPAEADGRRPVRVGPPARGPRARPAATTCGRRRASPATSPSTRPSRPRTPAASRYADRERARAARPALPRARAAADRRAPGSAGAREEVDGKRLRRWAHQFGFGGHCFTKSRRFSTTFKALREARALHAAGRAAPAGEAAAKSDHNLIHISAWRYAGRGYRRPATRSWPRRATRGRASTGGWRGRRRWTRRARQPTSTGRLRDGSA